ncbi:homoserine kinase [Maricaulis maris]|jgi:homoserine kinase|uniref:homoserine kinase n=1 Tax=Maricaulis maris TaxID=74318 RepID=UPI002922CF0F|nr:homoserine kinase [Maricaulis maris]
MTKKPSLARASAPASIGNVGVGFDVLGLAFDAVRDTVTVRRDETPGVRLGHVSGLVEALPDAVGDNCALAAANAVLQAAGAPFGVVVDIHKGVPLSAGMGGSAASAVAAAGAMNALLGSPFSLSDLLPLAMEGEKVSADPPPWDNVMAALMGGLVVAGRIDPPLIRRMPLPAGVACILFHPDRKVETQRARELLAPTIAKDIAVEHARNMASFVAGCAINDLELVRAGLTDIFIEPQRLPLLPELKAVQNAALAAGALGCSFSGSGPSVFAWALEDELPAVERAMAEAFRAADCDANAYDAPIDSAGLRVESVE